MAENINNTASLSLATAGAKYGGGAHIGGASVSNQENLPHLSNPPLQSDMDPYAPSIV